MIKTINIVNWRSHENTTLSFESGTNLLVGIMGSGKTSVLDAISYALFGTFPALERRQLKLENIIRYGANHASVSLVFYWNGNEYRVIRKIERKNDKILSKADLYRDGSLLESGATAVSEMIEEVLDIDYDLFTRAIYSEQNNIDYFLSLDPKKRKDEFDRILGLDRFEKARAATVSITNRLESVAKALLERYNEKREKEIEENVKALAEKESKINEEAAAIEKKLADAKKEIAAIKARFDILEKNRKLIEALSKELASLQGQVASLEIGLIKIDGAAYTAKKQEIEKAREKKLELQRQMAEKKKKEVEINKKIALADAMIKEQETRLERLEKLKKMRDEILQGKSKEEIIATFNERKKELEEKNSEKSALLQFVNQTKDIIRHLSPEMNACPLCETALGPEGIARVKKKKENEIKNAEEKITALLHSIRILQEENKKMEENVRKIDLIEQQIKNEQQQLVDRSELEKQKAMLKTALDDLLKTIEALESEEIAIQKNIEKSIIELNKMEEMLKRERMISEIKKKIVEASEKQKTIEYDEGEHRARQNALEEKRIEEQKLQTQAEYLQKERKLIAENRKAMEGQLQEMLSIKKQASATKEVIEELKIYKNALLETQIELRKELIEAINNAMNEIWGIFYPYGNYKAVRINITEKDYVFEVLEGEEWKVLESTASGGERACAALTLRVALAMILTPNLSWLVLDEPTHNLDSQAIALLSETLQTKIPQVVRQVFVITHEEALIGADFSRTYKLTRDKNAGGATKVEIL